MGAQGADVAPGGIGKAIALDLAAAGATVLVCGRRQSPLDETLASFPAGVEGKAYIVDLTDPAATRSFAGEVITDFGGVDILVHNAGFSSRIRSARYIDADEWQGVIYRNPSCAE